MLNWKETSEKFINFIRREKKLSANTQQAYLADIQLFINWLQKKNIELSPGEITRSQFKDFIYDLECSTSSQCRIISSIRSMFKFLNGEELVNNNPTLSIESPKRKKTLPESLSADEINKMISVLDIKKTSAFRTRILIELLYSSGIRISEAMNLKMTDISFIGECVKVVGKGNKERIVPIGKNILDLLQLLKSKETATESCYIFHDKNGKPMSRMVAYKCITRTAIKAGIDKQIGPHTFRHSFGTHLVQEGASLRAVQELLGHASVATTQIYTHVNQHYLRTELMSHHPMYSGVNNNVSVQVAS